MAIPSASVFQTLTKTKRLGIHYVDYTNNETRYVKDSSTWYKEFIAENS